MHDLSAAEITRILNKGGLSKKEQRNIASGNVYFVRDSDGLLVRATGKPPTGGIGKFEGKVGTVSRSRKGSPRRNANGRRYYVPAWDNEVVMY